MIIRSVNIAMLLSLIMVCACQSGDTRENKKLSHQLDSVNHELESTRQELMDSKQVRALLDSIDASRRITDPYIGSEEDTENNIARLNDINEYVKDINIKMDQMEKSIRYVNSMSVSILKLQADIEARSQKIAKLEAEAKSSTGNNKEKLLISTMQRKDSTLAVFLKTCEQDIAVLQKTMEEVHTQNNIATANLYFKQAETLTAMAGNVVSSSKRKFVQREALEMYRISLSLGKKEAEQKISALERAH